MTNAFQTAADLFKAADAAQKKFVAMKRNAFQAYVIADSRKDPLPMNHFDAQIAKFEAEANARNAALAEVTAKMTPAEVVEFFTKVAA